MKRAFLLIPLIALGLSACETDRPYRGSLPPEEMQPPLEKRPGPAASRPAPSSVTSAGSLKPQNIAIYMDALEKELRGRLRGSNYLIARRGDELVIAISNSQLFDNASSVLPAAEGWFSRMTLSLRRYDRTKIEVSGFTDTTGANDTNLEVSTRRAQKIADEIIADGVKSARVSAIGYGETRLRVNTGDEVNEPRNRRIEIRLTAQPG